ncbi:MAG: site-specific integrase [Clostridia bacterium]|nr:site-specific integrase [Clostridia bacterium]
MRKRGQNEGTIRKRIDGRWEGRAIIGRTIDGKPKFKYILRKTRAEVASELSKVLAELAEDAYIDETKVTFVGWLKTWLETYAKPSIKLSTYTSYETYIRGHCTPYFKNLKLKDLNPKILQDFFNNKLTGGRLDNKEGGLSDKTLKNLYNMIHASLKQAYLNEMIKKNICEFIKVPKVSRKEMRVLTREEQTNLITASRNHRLGIVVILDLFTGMRLGEILALRWNDIDFNKNLIYVKNTIKRVTTHNLDGSKTEIILDTPKTDNAFRVIPLIDEMKIELKNHSKIQNKEKQIGGTAYNNKNFVFCNEIGEPYDQKTFKNYYNKILLECGLIDARPKTIRDKIKKGLKSKPKPKGSSPNVTFHTLRHTFATRAIEQGMDVLVLSKILGHSDPSTTLNKYGHVLPNHKKDNMEKIRELYVV